MSSIQRIKGRRRWRVRWREGGRGSPLKPSPWFDSLADAEDYQRKLDARLNARKVASNRLTIPLDELVERWANRQQERQRPRSERYVRESRRTLLALIAERGWQTTEDVTEPDCPLGTFRLLKALLRYARDYHQQIIAPMALLPPDRPRRRRAKPALLTMEDAIHLVAEATRWSPADGAIAHLVAIYGHRPQSLVGLPCSAVAYSFVGTNEAAAAPQMGFLTLPVKNGDVVRHPLLPGSLELLVPLLRGRRAGDHLFRSHTGKPWSTGQAYSAWFHHSVGKGRGVYLLKRFAISLMHAGGLDVPTISSITGHSTDTVLKYLATNDYLQQQAMTIIARNGVAGVTNVRPLPTSEVVVSNSLN